MIAFVLGLVFFAGISGTAVADSPGLEVRALVYASPPTVVSRVSGGDDGKGGIIGSQVGGVVTSQFPGGVVFLKLDAAVDSLDHSIRSAIGDNFYFQCGGLFTERLTVHAIGGHVFRLTETPPEEGLSAAFPSDDEEIGPIPRAVLRLSPIVKRGTYWIVELRCDVMPTEIHHGIETTIRALTQVVEIEPLTPMLIGFPCHIPGKGRFIYWIALLIAAVAKS